MYLTVRTQRQGLSGFFSDVLDFQSDVLDFFNPASAELTDIAEARRRELEPKPIFGTQAYLEWEQRVLAAEAARKAAEAKAAFQKTASPGPNLVTVGIVALGAYVLFFRKK